LSLIIFLLKSIVTPNNDLNEATTSKGLKRAHEGSHTQVKAKGIRKIQNSSSYGLQASSVQIGENSNQACDDVDQVYGGDDDDDVDEEDEEEEEDEEAPDNISLGQKTLAIIAHSIQSFQERVLEYANIASKATEQTNTLLKNFIYYIFYR
jgi:TATA-binding protein-associated factor Taf7